MEEKILDILAEVCEDDIVKSDRSIELIESGILDSLAYAELLMTIEDELGIVIAPSEIEREALSTPEKIISIVLERS